MGDETNGGRAARPQASLWLAHYTDGGALTVAAFDLPGAAATALSFRDGRLEAVLRQQHGERVPVQGGGTLADWLRERPVLPQ